MPTLLHHQQQRQPACPCASTENMESDPTRYLMPPAHDSAWAQCYQLANMRDILNLYSSPLVLGDQSGHIF